MELLYSLEDQYRHWWDPTWSPPSLPGLVMAWSPYRIQPRCGCWVSRTEPVPLTARWALVHGRYRRSPVLYCRSRAAALSYIARLPLEDHPHVSLIPIERLEVP